MGDSLLIEIEKLGIEAISLLKEKLPWAWEIVARQIWVEAITDVLWSVPLTIFLIALAFWFNKKYQANQNEDWEFGLIPSIIFGFAFAIFSLISVVHLARVMYNPDYYILEKFMELATVGGM